MCCKLCTAPVSGRARYCEMHKNKRPASHRPEQRAEQHQRQKTTLVYQYGPNQKVTQIMESQTFWKLPEAAFKRMGQEFAARFVNPLNDAHWFAFAEMWKQQRAVDERCQMGNIFPLLQTKRLQWEQLRAACERQDILYPKETSVWDMSQWKLLQERIDWCYACQAKTASVPPVHEAFRHIGRAYELLQTLLRAASGTKRRANVPTVVRELYAGVREPAILRRMLPQHVPIVDVPTEVSFDLIDEFMHKRFARLENDFCSEHLILMSVAPNAASWNNFRLLPDFDVSLGHHLREQLTDFTNWKSPGRVTVTVETQSAELGCLQLQLTLPAEVIMRLFVHAEKEIVSAKMAALLRDHPMQVNPFRPTREIPKKGFVPLELLEQCEFQGFPRNDSGNEGCFTLNSSLDPNCQALVPFVPVYHSKRSV